MLHMQAARDEETLVVSSPMPLSARDEGFLKGFKGTVFVPDVMLAAGSSTNFTIELLHSFGIPNERIVIGCIIAAPEGVFRLLDNYPGIKIIAATVDNCLDKNAYISPGLGDAGDLLFDRITIEYFRRIFHIFDKGQWEHLGELIRKANPE
jgi:uracil phosphoribosyltransferase